MKARDEAGGSGTVGGFERGRGRERARETGVEDN